MAISKLICRTENTTAAFVLTRESTAMAGPDKQTTKVTDVFFGFFTSTLVCEIVSMRVWLLGNYLLGISKLWWMGVQSRCFNPDKGSLSVP